MGVSQNRGPSKMGRFFGGPASTWLFSFLFLVGGGTSSKEGEPHMAQAAFPFGNPRWPLSASEAAALRAAHDAAARGNEEPPGEAHHAQPRLGLQGGEANPDSGAES